MCMPKRYSLAHGENQILLEVMNENLLNYFLTYSYNIFFWPQWLIWMRRLTGDREVAGSALAEVGNILLWRLIIKYFLWSFSPFC